MSHPYLIIGGVVLLVIVFYGLYLANKQEIADDESNGVEVPPPGIVTNALAVKEVCTDCPSVAPKQTETNTVNKTTAKKVAKKAVKKAVKKTAKK